MRDVLKRLFWALVLAAPLALVCSGCPGPQRVPEVSEATQRHVEEGVTDIRTLARGIIHDLDDMRDTADITSLREAAREKASRIDALGDAMAAGTADLGAQIGEAFARIGTLTKKNERLESGQSWVMLWMRAGFILIGAAGVAVAIKTMNVTWALAGIGGGAVGLLLITVFGDTPTWLVWAFSGMAFIAACGLGYLLLRYGWAGLRHGFQKQVVKAVNGQSTTVAPGTT